MKCPNCDFTNPADTRFCGNCGRELIIPEDRSAVLTKTLQAVREELTTGSTFAGRYQVIEELGKGGMGRVYKVLDQEVNEKVALKLLNPEIAADEQTIERFRNELKLARKIGHRNVCRMFDLSREGETQFITMEYVSGEDLKSLIRQMGQFTVGKAALVAKQVCEGLAEAHRLGVVHRDLKPQNIMLDKEGNVRIMDFGIARSLKTKGITDVGVMIGTPEYMSPEQAELKEVDQRSDIYSLGIILYEMLTGRVPFEGETPLSVAMKHKSELPKDPKEYNAQIPEDLSQLVLKCLEKDRAKRYQNAEEMLADLIKIEKGIPTTEVVVPERKPFTSKEITVQFRLNKIFVPALVFVAFIIIGFILWQVLRQREAAPLLLEQRASVAVINFENQTGDEAFDHLRKVIPNLLITSLEQSGYLRVATWERMKDLLKQMGREDVETIDKDLGFELCTMEGIDAIVLGSFAKAGNMFATDVKVLDVKTKNLLKSVSSKGEGEGSIIKTQIDELSKEISTGIGIPEREIDEVQKPIVNITTSSMEAYNYFLGGRENYEKFYYEEARRMLEKSVEIDPTFAMAYNYLASTYQGLGKIEARDEAYEKAKAFSQKATEKERLYIEAAYAGVIEKNTDKELRILKEMVEKFPKEKRAHFELGRYFHLRNIEKAIEGYQKAIELDPYFGYAINQLAYVYAGIEDYEKAIELFKKYASVSPGDANPIDSMAELYFMMGRLDDAIAKYKEVLEVKPDFYVTHWRIAYIYALKEDYLEAMSWIDQYFGEAVPPDLRGLGHTWRTFYHYWLGSLEKSKTEYSMLANLAAEAGNLAGKAGADWMLGWIYYDRGEFEKSRNLFKSWFDIFVDVAPVPKSDLTAIYNFYLGLVDLKEGKIDSAKLKLAEMKAILPKTISFFKAWLEFNNAFLHGEILLAEGKFNEVVTACKNALIFDITPPFQQILPLNIPFNKDVLARAYREMGELDKAITEYERLLTFDPARKERWLIYPKYYYWLATLYEEKGWKEKAIKYYKRFLELWKDADPDIFEVIDAKKRLAAIGVRPS